MVSWGKGPGSAGVSEGFGALLDQYDILGNDEMEAIDVCQAWDGAKNMYHRGYSVEDTAGIVEEDVATVEKWFEEFSYS